MENNVNNKDKIANGLRSSIAFVRGDTVGARVSTYMIPNPPAVAAFLRDLTELSRKHKIAMSGEPILFEMEPVDMSLEYRADDDSVVSFG